MPSRTLAQSRRAPKTKPSPRSARSSPPLLFFTPDEAEIVEAITARLIPRDGDSPGAREAAALIYIDRAVGGYFSSLQIFYREGLAMVERIALERHAKSFANLKEAQQDGLLKAIETPSGPHGSERSAQFFAVILEHTIEGVFGDPAYGGNRDGIGWKMIEFPGAQHGYTPEQMAAGHRLENIPIRTLADIQAHKPEFRERKQA